MSLNRFAVTSRVTNVGAFQGVAVGPSNFWTTQSDQIFRYSRAWGLQTSRLVNSDDPLVASQRNGTVYDPVTDRLYVGANNFPATPPLGWIVEYNKTDITWIATHVVEPHHAEGCAIRNGEFWVFYNDWPFVTRYDASWTKIADVALPGYVSSLTGSLFQGGFWIGDDLYINRHNSSQPTCYFVFHWTGSAFQLLEVQPSPFTNLLECGQGIAYEAATNKAWWAQREGSGIGHVVETDVISLPKPGVGWTLLGSSYYGRAISGVPLVMDTTGADFLYLEANISAGTVSVTDSFGAGNVWNQLTAVTATANRTLRRWWCKPASVGPGHTITIAGATFSSATLSVRSGAHATPFLVESTANSATQAGPITAGQDGSLIIASICSRTDAVLAIDSGLTIDRQLRFFSGTYDGGAQASLVQNVSAPINPAWSTAESVGIAAFRAADTTPQPPTPGGGIIKTRHYDARISNGVFSVEIVNTEGEPPKQAPGGARMQWSSAEDMEQALAAAKDAAASQQGLLALAEKFVANGGKIDAALVSMVNSDPLPVKTIETKGTAEKA